jgi:hypothetical protein
VADHGIVVFGIPIPSSSPVFLSLVAVHVAAGVTCTVAGAIAMLAIKRAGRHPLAGKIYFWSLLVVFATTSSLSAIRWPVDNHLLTLGILSFATGFIGRAARRHRWPGWIRIHMSGMALSYILLLTAFYVDNGPNLPLWRHLSPIAYWLLPSVVGLPILVYALLRHPLVRRESMSQPPNNLPERKRAK